MAVVFYCMACRHNIDPMDVDADWNVGTSPRALTHTRAPGGAVYDCGPIEIRPAPRLKDLGQPAENFKRISDILRRSSTEDAEGLIRCLEINVELMKLHKELSESREKRVRRLLGVLTEIQSMSSTSGYDSGHSGIYALVTAQLTNVEDVEDDH